MASLDVVLTNCCNNKAKFKILYDCSPNPDEELKVCEKCFQKPYFSNQKRIKNLEVIA